MAVRHADGSVEAWRDLQYLPPLQVVVGVANVPQARSWRAGDPLPEPVLVESIISEVYSGPGAEFPRPVTAREFAWMIEDEWLAAHARLAQ